LQIGAETGSRTGAGTASEQEQKHVPEQAQKQDLRLFLNLVHQEIKLEMIVWLRIYLFHDHESTKSLHPLDQILSNINLGVQTRKLLCFLCFPFYY